MNRTPREVLDRWIAFNAVEPLPMPWNQTAAVAAEIYGLLQMIAAQKGIKMPNQSPAEWIPTADQIVNRTKPAKPATLEDQMSWAMRKAGLR